MVTRSEQKVDSTAFWHILLPVLTIVILLAVLFMIYTLPDWALTCSSGLESVRRLASRTPQ